MSIHSEACINEDEATRKRKRDDDDDHNNGDSDTRPAIDSRAFSIRPHTSTPLATTRTFTPQCLIHRAQLPLVFLDTTCDSSRLFSAHVQILEACHDCGNDANVLIVEEAGEGRLHAVERLQKHRYTLCRLGSHVRKDTIIEPAKTHVRPQRSQNKRHTPQSPDAGKPWWVCASVDTSTTLETWTGQRPKLSLQAATEGMPVSAGVVQAEENYLERAQPAFGELQPDTTTSLRPTSPEDALEELGRQYLDTLYLSRTPLAYFVKGPLARARATFSAQPAGLVGFLRGAIMLAPVADKKYRDNVSEIVKEMPLLETPERKPRVRRRRKWKPRRDKHGFFVDERDYVEQWWRKDDDTARPPSSVESLELRLQRRLRRLRNRETFLQVILILETMALEASAPPSSVLHMNLESRDVDSQAQDTQLVAGERKPKKKKEIDLPGIMETLIDRLCIWYSLESSSPLKAKNDNGSAAQDEAKDDLKDFAAEVVIPFWGSRILEQANKTSKKLGGPAAPQVSKRKSAPAPKKPGEPATRPMPDIRPRKPLERASTDTLNRKRDPSWHRAATDQDALAPLVKRERSEQLLLNSIPLAAVKPQARKHLSLIDQVVGSRRQVDFSVLSQASEAKMREKAKREQLVREAVSGIRKPNRSLATEETARKADEDFARELAKKKSKPQIQRSTTIKDAAPITATPQHVKATPAPRRRAQPGTAENSDTLSKVPCSSLASLFARPEIVGSTPAGPKQSPGVGETPSRGFAKFLPAGLAREPGTLIESPSASRKAHVAATPSKPLSSVTAKNRLKAVVEVSPRQTDIMDNSGIGLENLADTAHGSIYKTLGWDDYDDYEPLQ